jgi:hypothetical protein
MNHRSLLLFVVLLCQLAHAQQKEDSKPIEELRKEVSQLRAQIDSLKIGQQESLEVDLDALSERLEKRLRDLENKIDAVSRSTAPTILNPRTTAFINFAARADDHKVMDDPGEIEIDNRPFLRGVELDLRAAVDPYSEAVTVLSVEDEAGKGFAMDAEEAYGLIKRLPLLEEAPLGLKLKIGKFRAPFGTNNRIHMHDLPWTTRPLVVSKFLGTEHGNFFESGFNPIGIDLDFFLPNPIPSTTLEMNIDVLRAGDLAFGQGHDVKQPALLGHLALSKDINNEHLILIGASAYHESGISSTRLFGGDITYKWAPAERRSSQSLVAGGEVFAGNHSFTDSTNASVAVSAYGWFAYLQYQLSYWTYVGVRYDWIQEPTDNTMVGKGISAYVSYYTTEFLRLRIGFEHKQSDMLPDNLRTVNSVVFDVNFVFGSHPVEPYWVNR